ncbi:MAG: glycosyltransferase family A protein [Solirubrobacteraceae bacterium]
MDALGDVLAAAGLQVERSLDRFPPWREDVVYLFVPHEYMPFVEDEAHPSSAHLSRSVVLCTEQPGTSWFEDSAAIASRAAAAVDINLLGARELRRRGIEADLMKLGYFAGWDTWGGEDEGERPVDVTFMGAYTPRRARALARCARFLVGRRVELTMTESLRPHLEDSTHFLSGERRWAALRRSKLIINVHRSELGYLEWLRVIGAMLNGCVVLTEHSVGFEPLIPGEHFVSVSYDSLPFAIDAILADPQRMGEIRHAAYRFLRDELPLSSTITPLVRAIGKVAATRLEPSIAIPVPVSPSPRRPSLPPIEYERIFANRGDLDRVKAAIKDLLLGQVEMRRQLVQLSVDESLMTDTIERVGSPDHNVRVSVVLTVYNYADVVRNAIMSVARSDYECYELVVVDDCSRDDSLTAVRTELASHPQMAATIISRGRNQGLSAARNCAVEHARGEFIFILDADNMIYPHALSRLVAALDDAPLASFAYGIIEQFGPEGPRDLISWQDWDPERLRYGNYIDAMAMIRRAAIIDVGGYTLDRRLQLGWEDFDLWCAFADRGWQGIRVPEILSRYRTGTYSMISTTDVDSQAAWGALVERHTFLTANSANYEVAA